jgi:hypothetical protein
MTDNFKKPDESLKSVPRESLITVIHILHFFLRHVILMQVLHYCIILGLRNYCRTTTLNLPMNLTIE